MKYIVNNTCSFVHKGKLYAPGMEITSEAFSSEKDFAAAVAQKMIVADGKPDAEGKDAGTEKADKETKKRGRPPKDEGQKDAPEGNADDAAGGADAGTDNAGADSAGGAAE